MPFQFFSLEDLILPFNVYSLSLFLLSREKGYMLHKHSSKACINRNKIVQTVKAWPVFFSDPKAFALFA